MQSFFTAPRLRVLSALFTNLAAGWLGTIAILPIVVDFSSPGGKIPLLFNALAAIVSVSISFAIEKKLELL